LDILVLAAVLKDIRYTSYLNNQRMCACVGVYVCVCF